MEDSNLIRKEAWSHHAKGDTKKAETIYRTLLNNGPEPTDIGNLGALLRKQSRNKEALELYQHWIPKVANNEILTINAVNTAIDATEYQLAETWLKNSLGKNKGSVELLRAKSYLLRAQDKNKEALGILEELVRQNCYDMKSLEDIGKIYCKTNKTEAAERIFKQIMIIEPLYSINISNFISLLEENKRHEQVDRLIKLLSKNQLQIPSIKASVGMAYFRQKNIEEAYHMFKELCISEPKEARHWLNQCACLRALKHGVEALEVAKKGHKLNPEYKKLKYALSQCLAELSTLR